MEHFGQEPAEKSTGNDALQNECPTLQSDCLAPSLQTNIAAMRALFRDDNDFVVRQFEIPAGGGVAGALLFIDGLVQSDTINRAVLQPLLLEIRRVDDRENLHFQSLLQLGHTFLLAGELGSGTSYAAACDACLSGDAVLMVEGFAEFVFIGAKGFERRSITEPQTETVVRGPREGFTEVLRTNTALLRRKLKTPHLRMELMQIGKQTKTSVCLSYIDNIANPALMKEVKKRLHTIDTDAILNSGYIEEFIEDSPRSLFQTIYHTEKPDIVAAKLLEGRCALIIDGTPFVLTMPMLFTECLQSPEDYAVRPCVATFLRIMRSVAFFLSLTFPAIYIALTSFHQELIPTTLLFTIAASSESVPFNSVVETAIMLLTFEIMKDAGVRLPRAIGQTVSIVGALVMGQAAIQAGLVGAPVVIVVAFTAVASFLSPGFSDAISLLRWYFWFLASVMGGFGITLGLMTVLIHLAAMESFGAPYLYPLSPLSRADAKDSIVRVPMWKMRTRPAVLRPQNIVRQNMAPPEFGQDGDE